MLVAGSNSVCDVCLESFGCDGKAPCSISCGHVFCVDCLEQITRPTCPLCRNYFDTRATVKLHLDMDNVRSSPTAGNTLTVSDEQDARRLYQAIANIAEEGCSEVQVRQLISDGKAFLQKHPRDNFKDLRTLHRMVAYLCEVKTNLRAQKAAVESLTHEQAQLQAEKAELLRNIELQMRVREEEKNHALAIEMSLREHCSKAHEAYETMVQQYNYVAKEWTRMNEEVKKARLARNSADGLGSLPPIRTSPLGLDQAQLKGAAVQDEGSILISPLPEFTGRFNPNTTLSVFMPLPDVEEGDEEESDESDEEESEEEEVIEKPKVPQQHKQVRSSSPCNAAGHPYSCNCVGFSLFDESRKAKKDAEAAQPGRRSPSGHTEAVKQPTSDGPPRTLPPSGLTRTAPPAEARLNRARSRSIPSESLTHSQSSSRAPSRSVSPVRSAPPPPRPAVRQSPPSRDADLQAGPLNASRPTDNEGLRSRLQTLLTDSSPVSSSLPNLSNHFPGSVTASRDARPPREERQRSPSRSPSPRSSAHLRRHSSQVRHSQQQQQQSRDTTDQFSRLLASHQPAVSAGPQPPSSTSPNPRTSSASDAARLIEQSKRDRLQADKEERQRRKVQEKERSQPERERERTRTTSGSSLPQAPASASSSYAAGISSSTFGSGAGPRPSNPLNGVSTASAKAIPAASSSHREFNQAQQLAYQSRYNTANGKGLHSSALSPSNPTGIYA